MQARSSGLRGLSTVLKSISKAKLYAGLKDMKTGLKGLFTDLKFSSTVKKIMLAEKYVLDESIITKVKGMVFVLFGMQDIYKAIEYVDLGKDVMTTGIERLSEILESMEHLVWNMKLANAVMEELYSCLRLMYKGYKLFYDGMNVACDGNDSASMGRDMLCVERCTQDTYIITVGLGNICAGLQDIATELKPVRDDLKVVSEGIKILFDDF